MKLPVHRIIPFSNVEGYGNRTSIFTQGCNANCLYCHNSETIPKKSDDVKQYSVQELVDVIKHQMSYIRGITVSGGEATLHHKLLQELFPEVHKLGLTCYIDTNGFFDYDKIQDLIAVTDQFLYDVKALGQPLNKLCFSSALLSFDSLENDAHQRFGMNNEHIDNLKKLLALHKVEEVRHVYLKNTSEYQEVLDTIFELLQAYPKVIFKLIKMHHRGLPIERIKLLKGSIPTTKDFDEVKAYADSLGFHRPVYIE